MPPDSIHALVYRALRGSQLVLASPETVARAIEKGEPITAVPELPTEVALDRLFENRRKKAQAVAPNLLPCPVDDAPILYLYDQIRECILFGLNGTALVLCGILVEYALKVAVFNTETGSTSPFDPGAWEKYENITLSDAITRAKRADLIDDAQERQLRGFARNLRNRHSHFNIQKVTEGFVFLNVEETNIETGETRTTELSASETPTLQIIAKEKLDDVIVLDVFGYCNDVVGFLLATSRSSQAQAPPG